MTLTCTLSSRGEDIPGETGGNTYVARLRDTVVFLKMHFFFRFCSEQFDVGAEKKDEL